MKVSVLSIRDIGSSVIPFVFAVDPGLKTAGFCLFDGRDYNFKLDSLALNDGVNVMRLSYAELYTIAKKTSKEYIKVLHTMLKAMGGVSNPKVSVSIEHSFLSGEFSLSLAVLITVLIEDFSNIEFVDRIILVPPNIGAFFLKQRKSNKTAVINLVKSNFPDIANHALGRKGIVSHSVDAFLQIVFLYYQRISNTYNCCMRVPSYDIIKHS